MSSESPALFEIIHSLRAMRRLKPDPVPDGLVNEILRAAVAAPSGGNRQPWAFIVVKDPEIKQQVQVYYRRALDEVMASAYGSVAPADGIEADRHRRQFAAVTYLTDHFHEAPVWIVACLDGRDEMLEQTKDHPIAAPRAKGASIYPAVQNILLAARALGLGATLTTRHVAFADEVDSIFGLPDGVQSYAIVPIGYPLGNFGPVRRRPLKDVVHLDQWGKPAPGLA